MTTSARSVALEAVRRVTEHDAYSSIVERTLLRRSSLDDRDRSLATNLAFGTLRRLRTLDFVIEANPWYNANRPNDVTGDSHVAPNDALAIINYINAFGSGTVPGLTATVEGQRVDFGKPFGYLDVNHDTYIAPNDALAVINAINSGQGGEGESLPAESGTTSDHLESDWLDLISRDIAVVHRGSNT